MRNRCVCWGGGGMRVRNRWVGDACGWGTHAGGRCGVPAAGRRLLLQKNLHPRHVPRMPAPWSRRHIWPGVTLEEVLEAQPPEALAAAGANGAAGGKGCDAAAAAGVLRALPGGAAPDAAGRPVAAQRASRRRQARLSAIKMEQLLGEVRGAGRMWTACVARARRLGR